MLFLMRLLALRERREVVAPISLMRSANVTPFVPPGEVGEAASVATGTGTASVGLIATWV